ncbi:Diacylglycerol kinase family enzyme [Friedmanniella luteola]|uniref:Diacylglycerol kinase family enzyme n=1 Tax=Friedmanniella luteola TaxID=546871 RepID=A0A1H1ZYW5_9ACTN|nr:diacylglycerol kinase family protein [Friedmanniella luteola]SDT38873.1 Diacylglycerol kinase family enzyme [Friedmanniella luteola]
MPDVPSDATRCAVVYNPTKISDGFRALVDARAAEAGWAEPLWLETSEDDPGRAMTREALDAGVDLVLTAGGDGTVRVVADVMAGSGVTLAVIPAGTGNLLARNLDLPLEEAGALDVALAGRTRTIDLVELTVDGGRGEHFAVMAGVGVDATIMDEVNPDLKAKVGPAAYFVAASKALGRLPIPMEISVDGGRRHRRRAMTCLVGNVGKLPGGLVLMPHAEVDDGRLDVYVASPLRVSHWFKLVLRVVTRRKQRDDQVDSWQADRVVVSLRRPEAYQLDGDVVGEGRELVAVIRPGALTVCVP